MKLGRNDPCHCDSGKKYKKCCLKSDQLKERETTNASSNSKDPFFDGLEEVLTKTFESDDTSATELLDPLEQARDDFYESFTGAVYYSNKIKLLETILSENPEFCDNELIFELIDDLYGSIQEDSEFEQFIQITELIEKQTPEAWEKEKHYILDYQATAALMLGKVELARATFLRFSECAANDLEVYNRMLSCFAWHGEAEVIIEGLTKARESIKAVEEKFIPGTYEEKRLEQADFDLFNTISKIDKNDLQKTNSQALPEIKALKNRLLDDEIVVDTEFDEMVSHLLAEKQPSTNLEDYKLDIELHLKRIEAEDSYDYWDSDEEDEEPEEIESDPAEERIAYLLHSFRHYACHEENILMTRLQSGTAHLKRFLLKRGYGDLNEVQMQTKPKRSKYNKSKKDRLKNSPPKQAEQNTLLATHPLLFNAHQVENYMNKYGYQFLFTPYYDLAAFYELLPIWIKYLNKLEFLDKDMNEEILAPLKPQIESFIEQCKIATQDKALIEKLSNWPSS